jgi:hypothetical protein
VSRVHREPQQADRLGIVLFRALAVDQHHSEACHALEIAEIRGAPIDLHGLGVVLVTPPRPVS